ncbi:MAG: LAGLIDADG family homing endonuclease [Microgenomates group bacterium]|jgi:hypothetical protein
MHPTALKDSRGGHNHAQINQDFFKTWSPAMSYILGFIFADGAIEDVQKSSRTYYISITSKDLSILNSIKKFMSSTHKLYTKPLQKILYPGGKYYISSERFVLRIGSKNMYNDLLKLGVTPRKSLSIKFPIVPTEYLSFFIRGYFDGDGCLHLLKGIYPRLIFTSGSNQFFEGLSATLSQTLQIPIKSAYQQLQQSNNFCYRLHYNTKISHLILEYMYRDLEKAPFLDRKYVIYQKYLQTKE